MCLRLPNWNIFFNTYGNGLCPSNVVVATIVMDYVEISNPHCLVFFMSSCLDFVLWIDAFDIKQCTCHC